MGAVWWKGLFMTLSGAQYNFHIVPRGQEHKKSWKNTLRGAKKTWQGRRNCDSKENTLSSLTSTNYTFRGRLRGGGWEGRPPWLEWPFLLVESDKRVLSQRSWVVCVWYTVVSWPLARTSKIIISLKVVFLLQTTSKDGSTNWPCCYLGDLVCLIPCVVGITL